MGDFQPLESAEAPFEEISEEDEVRAPPAGDANGAVTQEAMAASLRVSTRRSAKSKGKRRAADGNTPDLESQSPLENREGVRDQESPSRETMVSREKRQRMSADGVNDAGNSPDGQEMGIDHPNVHTCVPEGEEPPFPAADCEACRGDLRLLQNQAPLAGNRDLGDFRVASDDYALWADFTKLELKVVLVTLAALPVKYRKVFVDRRTFETMAATVFRELGLQWARSPWMKDEGAKKTVGFSAIELVTQANVNSKVVKGSLIQEKFRTNSAWFIWDMEDRAWFRCWTTTPPWSSCIQLEVQTLIESEVVQKYEGRVGGVFRKPGIFDAFVNHFERMETQELQSVKREGRGFARSSLSWAQRGTDRGGFFGKAPEAGGFGHGAASAGSPMEVSHTPFGVAAEKQPLHRFPRASFLVQPSLESRRVLVEVTVFDGRNGSTTRDTKQLAAGQIWQCTCEDLLQLVLPKKFVGASMTYRLLDFVRHSGREVIVRDYLQFEADQGFPLPIDVQVDKMLIVWISSGRGEDEVDPRVWMDYAPGSISVAEHFVSPHQFGEPSACVDRYAGTGHGIDSGHDESVSVEVRARNPDAPMMSAQPVVRDPALALRDFGMSRGQDEVLEAAHMLASLPTRLGGDEAEPHEQPRSHEAFTSQSPQRFSCDGTPQKTSPTSPTRVSPKWKTKGGRDASSPAGFKKSPGKMRSFAAAAVAMPAEPVEPAPRSLSSTSEDMQMDVVQPPGPGVVSAVKMHMPDMRRSGASVLRIVAAVFACCPREYRQPMSALMASFDLEGFLQFVEAVFVHEDGALFIPHGSRRIFSTLGGFLKTRAAPTSPARVLRDKLKACVPFSWLHPHTAEPGDAMVVSFKTADPPWEECIKGELCMILNELYFENWSIHNCVDGSTRPMPPEPDQGDLVKYTSIERYAAIFENA